MFSAKVFYRFFLGATSRDSSYHWLSSGYHFIDNNKITTGKLWKDDLHLTNSSKGSSKVKSGCSNKSNFIDAKVGLQEMKSKCPDKLTMGHLNANSIPNKFDALSLIVKNNVNILMISETKLDYSFATAHFLLHGFSAPYRLDRNLKSGGILLYIREDIPSRFLNSKSKTSIETISAEINLRKRKWFLNCSYNANKNLISNHLECLVKITWQCHFLRRFQNLHKRQCNDVLLLIKSSNKYDRSTNLLQKS